VRYDFDNLKPAFWKPIEVGGIQFYTYPRNTIQRVFYYAAELDKIMRSSAKILQLKDRIFEPWTGRYGKIVEVYYQSCWKRLVICIEYFTVDNSKKRERKEYNYSDMWGFDNLLKHIEETIQKHYS